MIIKDRDTTFTNPWTGASHLTTHHAASSYGVPILVGHDGTAYGPADLIIEPFNPAVRDRPRTAAQVVRAYALQQPHGERALYDAAEQFLSERGIY